MSTRAVRLQWAFDVLTEFFDRFGLQKNVRKKVGTIYQPCCAIGGHSVELYVHQMTGEGMTHQAQ